MDIHFDRRRAPQGERQAPFRDANWLEKEDLVQLVRLGPLVSIDLIPRGPDGRILTGLRTNEPARGSWFVPGGRINKGESLDRAFRRISRSELGISMERDEGVFMGVFEHFYTTNFASEPDLGTHYVVMAYLIELTDDDLLNPDEQHLEWRWFTPEDLSTEKTVHRNTKVYGRLDFPPRPENPRG